LPHFCQWICRYLTKSWALQHSVIRDCLHFFEFRIFTGFHYTAKSVDSDSAINGKNLHNSLNYFGNSLKIHEDEEKTKYSYISNTELRIHENWDLNTVIEIFEY
jgi:hypothetical protein